MKLYVFQVNNGTTLTFDTELAVQTVADLKHAIQIKYKISIQNQVLVVNGGECMVADRRVCSYSAGTDTNPIFLFNKEMILCERPPTIPKTTFSVENEMELKVEESLMMPAVFHTVASRTQLAVEMFEVAKKLCSFCERLVHDEHLQHQGWAAIMANLDDCTLSYQKLLFKFETAYKGYQQSIEDIKQKLTNLGTAVSVMAKIPLLECLTRHSYKESLERGSPSVDREGTEDETEEDKSAESVLYNADPRTNNKSSVSFSITAGNPSQDSVVHEDKDTKSDSQNDIPGETRLQEQVDQTLFNVSLLDWINVQDRPNDVESVVRKCFDSMNRLDPRLIQPFLCDCRDTIAKLDNQNMKAIKGLEDRLYALDQMIASCKKLVNEQKELAQGFLANQKRAENLKDTSVLPDLCLSHANQLMIMLTNHRKLLDIKQKCTTAKQELANNLQVRLKWCCYVMLHADQDGEKLQALLRLLTELLERIRIVEALSTVPQMYCLAVVEVVRRKIFMKHYREWANALVKDGKELYEAEKAKRESFGKLFRKSFLRNRLFKGLDSWPPALFCTRKPRKFDFELPEISICDLQFLQSCCPLEVQPFLRVPTLCDFEPLNQHVQSLQQLVKAAQSVDEMSQTITDLLSEQKASSSPPTPSPTAVPMAYSTTENTSTSSKTPPSLSFQGALCQPLSLPAPLEELSPDSIDAHTFDFETIGHPNMYPGLKQESLDLDSLAESPESDFMSAVNEFVIEENLPSPNVISDPQSPEMMVESLYSSVINAIDSRRIQDNTTLEKESSKVALLKACIEKYRSAAEESLSSLKSIKEDLCHFQGLVQKEHRDFSFVLKSVSVEVKNIIDNIKILHEKDLKEMHQSELHILKKDYSDEAKKLLEESEKNQKDMDELKNVLMELEGQLKKKEEELLLLHSQMEMFIESEKNSMQKLQVLEKTVQDQNSEIAESLKVRDLQSEELCKLKHEVEQNKNTLKLELENLEKEHLREVEQTLHNRYAKEIEELKCANQIDKDTLIKDNREKLDHILERHHLEVSEQEKHIKDLEYCVSQLSETRCKLEVEMALKETELEDLKKVFEAVKSQEQDIIRYEVQKETEALKKEISNLQYQLQARSDEYEVGISEIKSLMRIERENCISELVDRHEKESFAVHSELLLIQQKAIDIERTLKEQIRQLQNDLENQVKTQEEEKENTLKEQRHFKTIIGELQDEKEHLSNTLEMERQTLRNAFSKEKEEAVKAAVAAAIKDLETQKEAIEAELFQKVKELESQIKEDRQLDREALLLSSSEVSTDERLNITTDVNTGWDEERSSFLEQLKELEQRKNEEMQLLKTSLIAEQQTNFNTVLTREKLKKEQIINELNEKLQRMSEQQERDKDLIETLSEDRANLLQEKKKMEEELNKLRSNSLVSSALFSSAATSADLTGACAAELHTDPERLASVAAIGEERRVDSAVEVSMMTVHENPAMLSEEKQKILFLERTLHMKEEENKRLNQRLMSQSMSSVSSRHSEKIAIRDFQVGDLVLIILDERHDNYVLFTVGPTLYFLHSESLTALDLKSASGSPRRPWVLGKVMEKEYCQAKKAQNRFKVPLGTKFYRVKAVPWNKKV
ncbi:LOW QUALITY PROTEIN: RB1-inducible coiled-coil protein 1 [Erpetoichthys calabaricus]|uniref:LOW QUALITY PROTEIN: RB1-inducible coiled-coil protein 1 n=1 Tax=Erpetoichthys calabaricus TaxID=27687 RepID=UPI002234700C|nr:LOW QUALITY PROTEIN: RB1-inducible coiled-coil protein 1 [Erpetoichthys calabaricus]